MKKQWTIPKLEVLDVKNTMSIFDDFYCRFFPKDPYCKAEGGLDS